jgi:hypothetical protein
MRRIAKDQDDASPYMLAAEYLKHVPVTSWRAAVVGRVQYELCFDYRQSAIYECKFSCKCGRSLEQPGFRGDTVYTCRRCERTYRVEYHQPLEFTREWKFIGVALELDGVPGEDPLYLGRSLIRQETI